MSGAPLLPLAGLAAVPAAVRAVAELAREGLGFAELLVAGRPAAGGTSGGDAAGVGPAVAVGQIDLARLRAEAGERLDRLVEMLRRHLRGVDPAQPLRLKQDGQGGVVEAGHPQRAAIEQRLNRDATFVAAFEQLASQYELLRAVEHPERARNGRMVLQVEAGGAAVVFE